jgi:hypothetical protein
VIDLRYNRAVRFLAFALVLAFAADARADEPWKKGVTPDQMAQAQKILEAGNVLLLEKDYAKALERYNEAIAVWDHPAIRFNIVRCLIQLDRMDEASDNLERALQYGAAPLEDTVYSEALSYQNLLAKQIATLAVRCEQPQVAVTLDGKPLLQCPGAITRKLVAGPHQLVGKRDGFIPKTVDITAFGGKAEQVVLALDPIGSRGNGKLVHKWPTWFPWVVVGAGVAVTGGGILVQRVAIAQRDDYFAQLEPCNPSCSPGFAQDSKDLATLENRIAIGMIVVGGGAIVTGAVLVYLNRGRLVYEDKPMPTVSATANGATVGVVGRF